MRENPFETWLAEVGGDEVLVDLWDVNAEAHANLWAFSLDAAQAARLRPAEVAAFVRSVSDSRDERVRARGLEPMRFYCWLDEQAVQLRFSLVSARHGRLPFGCPVAETDDLESIASAFLASPYHDGIRLGSEEGPEGVESGRTGPLRVWVRDLGDR